MIMWYRGAPSEEDLIPPLPGLLFCACGCDFYDDEGAKCPDCGREGHASESEAAAEWEDIRSLE